MKTIIIAGMPRSGTSWLGQIINSHPRVAFRTEPLFSYRFKNFLSCSSTDSDIQEFFDSLLMSDDDDFLMQKQHVLSGAYPDFPKNKPCYLAYKTSRHHELIERFLSSKLDIHVVGIVRHPCGAINSWIHSDKEFDQKGCLVHRDWQTGACRKDGVGEYWGFNDWLLTTSRFVDFASTYFDFSLVRYCDLVRFPITTSKGLFEGVGLSWPEQVKDFLEASHLTHNVDPYSVFKDKSVNDRWKSELDKNLAEEIISVTRSEGLSHFLE